MTRSRRVHSADAVSSRCTVVVEAWLPMHRRARRRNCLCCATSGSGRRTSVRRAAPAAAPEPSVGSGAGPQRAGLEAVSMVPRTRVLYYTPSRLQSRGTPKEWGVGRLYSHRSCRTAHQSRARKRIAPAPGKTILCRTSLASRFSPSQMPTAGSG